MVIEKIAIQSFGKLKDLTMEFSDGINVIEGQNEAGKSTIAAFLKYMFYGFAAPSGEDGRPDERQKRLNWETGYAAGSMTVRAGGKRYLITRSTTPSENGDSFKEDSSIVDVDTGAPVFGRAPAGQVFFGVERELFENTAFIGQVGGDIDESAVRESIENILFSGNEKQNARRALSMLEAKANALLHENGTGGLLHDLEQKKERLEEELAETDRNNRNILVHEAELHKLRTEREEAVAKLADLENQNVSYSNVMIIQSFDRLHELERENEEKTEAYRASVAAHTVDGFVPDGAYFEEVRAARATVEECRLRQAEAEVALIREKNAIGITREIEGAIALADSEGGEAKLTAKARALRAGALRMLILTIAAGLAAIAAGVFEIAAQDVGTFGRVVGFVLLGAALAGAGLSLFLFFTARKQLALMCAVYTSENYPDLLNKLRVIAEAREKRDRISVSTAAAEEALAAAKAAYAKALADRLALVRRWAPDMKDPPSDAALDDFEERLRAFLAEEASLRDAKTNSDITVAEIRRGLSSYSEIDVRAKVSPLKRKVLSGINHEDITKALAGTKDKIATLDRLCAEKEEDLSRLKLNERDPGEMHSRIQSLEEQIAEQSNKLTAYRIAAAAIDRSEEKLRAEISPRLSAYTTSLMEIMTNRKYDAISIDDGLTVRFGRGEDARPVDFLSDSTRDMAYVAVRMALIDMLYGETPPVCFDESFAHQDNLRARCMMQAISYLADTKDQQNFIFTCRSRESTLASDVTSKSAVFKLTSRKNYA